LWRLSVVVGLRERASVESKWSPNSVCTRIAALPPLAPLGW
jgi:hypothetical protein